MKSFIIQTEVNEMILTLRYFPTIDKIRLYLHGVTSNVNEDNKISYYEDGCSLFIPPMKASIIGAAKKLINYHFIWDKSSEKEFENFVDQLWKDCHKDHSSTDEKIWFI